MACFVVSLVEAVAVTVAAGVVRKKEQKKNEAVLSVSGPETGSEEPRRTPFSKKLKWLSGMLWGGSALLAFEHVWHGEIVPWFPFLTAASDPADAAEMLHVIATVGVAMAVLVTSVWLIMVAVSSAMEKRAAGKAAETAAESPAEN